MIRNVLIATYILAVLAISAIAKAQGPARFVSDAGVKLVTGSQDVVSKVMVTN